MSPHLAWFPGDGPLEDFVREVEEGKRALERQRLIEQGIKPPKAPPRAAGHISYIVGVDIGQRVDPTAIAVVETRYDAQERGYYIVRFLKRFKLGLLYAEVAKRVARLDTKLRQDAAKDGLEAWVTYILDATGVGQGPSEQIVQALSAQSYADVYRCYLTGGINAIVDNERMQIKLPKTQLVSCLVSVFDADHMELPARSKEIDAMIIELLNFEIRVSDEGRDAFGAFKVGTHDDLVTALGLAIWLGENSPPPYYGPMIW
jgi:hypothetical protein